MVRFHKSFCYLVWRENLSKHVLKSFEYNVLQNHEYIYNIKYLELGKNITHEHWTACNYSYNIQRYNFGHELSIPIQLSDTLVAMWVFPRKGVCVNIDPWPSLFLIRPISITYMFVDMVIKENVSKLYEMGQSLWNGSKLGLKWVKTL